MPHVGMAPHVSITGTALAALDVTSVRDGVLYYVTTTGGGYTAGETWQVGGTAGARILTLVAVTDVVAPGDTDASAFGFVVDEDNMASDSDTKIPTQQSVKAYVDGELATIDTLGDVDTTTTPPTTGQTLVWDPAAAGGAGAFVPGTGGLDADGVRDAGRWEVVVSGTAPPVAVTNEAEDDWVYGWVGS